MLLLFPALCTAAIIRTQSHYIYRNSGHGTVIITHKYISELILHVQHMIIDHGSIVGTGGCDLDRCAAPSSSAADHGTPRLPSQLKQ